MTVIFLIGLPERKPFAPAELNCASDTLFDCMLEFSNVACAVPLNTLLPLLVTMLMLRPEDCTETSPPPFVTWICSSESKLKYTGEEFDERSVIAPPSRFHCTFAVVPRVASETCWPDADPPTFRPAWTPGDMLMTCHGSRAVGIVSMTSDVIVMPVVVFFVSTNGAAAEIVT